MKVERIVGWITGLNGTGNIFEVSENGKSYLATIWQDGSFHAISPESVQEHISAGKAELSSNKQYINFAGSGAMQVTNPNGWERLHVTNNPPVPESETEISDTLEFPFSVAFEGKMKINIAGVSTILNLFNQ